MDISSTECEGSLTKGRRDEILFPPMLSSERFGALMKLRGSIEMRKLSQSFKKVRF